MPKYLKQLECTLHDLAMDFHYLMVEQNAKNFTIKSFGDTPFWYITDVTLLGTYPCHPTDDKGNVYAPEYFDYTERVVIHFN